MVEMGMETERRKRSADGRTIHVARRFCGFQLQRRTVTSPPGAARTCGTRVARREDWEEDQCKRPAGNLSAYPNSVHGGSVCLTQTSSVLCGAEQ